MIKEMPIARGREEAPGACKIVYMNNLQKCICSLLFNKHLGNTF